MTGFWSVVCGIFLAVASGAAQPQSGTPSQPPSQQRPQQPPPTFRTGAELVRVDVTVLDGRGRPVTTLSADDFAVEEDGVPQKIQTFQLLRLTGAPAPDDDLTLTIGPREFRPDEFGREDVRLFLIFWDEYHIQPDPAGRQLRDELVHFIRTMFAPTDLVAIMDIWTPMSDLWFSRDRYRLATQAGGLRGRLGVLVPPRNAAEENHLRDPRATRFVREQVSLSALRSAVMHLGTLRESRKALLYLGLEFGLGPDTNSAALEIIQEANAANVAIYSINPQGLRVTGSNFRSGMLASIAHDTGGESFLSNSPAMALSRAVTQSSASYLLGYAPAPLRHDGRFHKIQVRVRGSGLHVRARNGYLAPDAAQKRAARAAAAEAALPTPIELAFGELVPLGRPEYGDAPREVRTIMVPETPSAKLALRPPVVWLIQKPADLKAAQGSRPPPPHAGREFTRTDRILMVLSMEGELASGAELSVSLIDRRGRSLTDLPFTRREDGWLLDLPLHSIARGDYLIALEALHPTERASAFVPIRVK
jgi:VWFA-related protein